MVLRRTPEHIRFFFFQVMRESLAKLEGLCLGGTAKDQDWMAVVEDTRYVVGEKSTCAEPCILSCTS